MYIREAMCILIGLMLTECQQAPGADQSKVKYNKACQLPDELIAEISSHSSVVKSIVEYVLKNDTHKTYEILAYFVDTYGARPTGSKALEDSIDYLVSEMRNSGIDNVHTEDVAVEHYERGEESLLMLEPRNMKMAILGLGGTVGTSPEGITAEALIVESFEDLEARKNEIAGKIVVFGYNYAGYGTSYQYRTRGAVEAAKYGAVASLVRSATDYSLYTPHTGGQAYQHNVTAIPSAAITVEDSDFLKRIQKRGKKIVLRLKMLETFHPNTTSRNTVGEIIGTTYPEQLVIIGGHTDSWDVGQGAMDDGGGVFISWRALLILNHLGLKPKRTLRAVLWTAEEVGLVGAKAYYDAHKFEQGNISIALESDFGTFNPEGLTLHTLNNKTVCVVQEVLKLFEYINMSSLILKANGPDLTFWTEDGVNTGSLLNANDRYFHYHHTEADTMTVLDKDELDLCTAFWTAVSYVLANLNEMLPR